MKKLVLIAVMVMMVSPVWAETVRTDESRHGGHYVAVHDKAAVKDADDAVLGAKVDAPNLVKLMDNLYIGVEGSKDVHMMSFEEGWSGYVKVTYTGTLFGK